MEVTGKGSGLLPKEDSAGESQEEVRAGRLGRGPGLPGFAPQPINCVRDLPGYVPLPMN